MRGQIGVPHSVADHLVQRLQVIGIVYERSRSGRPRKTTPRENRLIARCARRNRFATSARIRDELNFGGGGYVSVRTVNRRINKQHLWAKRPIKQPQLSLELVT
jgi:transposase